MHAHRRAQQAPDPCDHLPNRHLHHRGLKRFGAKRLLVPLAIGLAILASQQGCSEEHPFTPEGVATVEITPPAITVAVGGTAVLTAAVRDDAGNTLGERPVEWSSSNSSVVTVNAGGQLTGVSEGTATVSATIAGQTAEADVRVVSVPTGPSTFYVDIGDAAASDDNPGTEELPWKTLYKAAATLRAGQTVYVKAGTYTIQDGCSWSRPAIDPENSGVAGAPIAFRAFPGNRVLLTNSVSGSACPIMGTNGADYIVVDGFEIVVVGERAVAVFNSTGSVIENNEIHGLRGRSGHNTDGVRVESSVDVIVRNNLIYDIHNEEDSPNGSAVKMYDNVRVIVENNEAYDVGAGLRNKVGGRDNVFRYNYVHNCTSYGIQIGVTTNTVAYHNVIENCGGAGVQMKSPAVDAQIYNNTFVNCGGYVVSSFQGTSDNLQVWNNIAYNCENRDLYDGNSDLSDCDYNLYWQTDEKCGSHNVVADPLFVDNSFQNPEDFRLQSGSPARGAGRNGGDIGVYALGNEVIGRAH